MESRSRHNSTKKGFKASFYHDVTVKGTCFPSRSITKKAETHPPPMRDVIIEQPLICIYLFAYLFAFTCSSQQWKYQNNVF